MRQSETRRGERMEFTLFGRPSANGEPLDAQAAAVLLLLARNPGRAQTRDEIIEFVWGCRPEHCDMYRRNLRVALSKGRRNAAFAELLPEQSQTYLLEVGESVSVDVLTFDELYQSALREPNLYARRSLLTKAVSISHDAGDEGNARRRPRILVDGYSSGSDRVAELRDTYERDSRHAAELLVALNRQLDQPWHGRWLTLREAAALAVRRHRPRRAHAAYAGLVLAGAICAWLVGRAALASAPMTADARDALIRELQDRPEPDGAQAQKVLALGDGMWAVSYTAREGDWAYALARVEPQTREALTWLTVHNRAQAIHLVGALTRYWDLRDEQGEVYRLAKAAVGDGTGPGSRDMARALTCLAACQLSTEAGGTPAYILACTRSLDLARRGRDMFGRLRDRVDADNALRIMAHAYNGMRNYPEADRCFQQAIDDLHSNTNAPPGLEAYAYWGLGLVASNMSDGPEDRARAIELVLTSYRMYRDQGNDWGMRFAAKGATGMATGYDLGAGPYPRRLAAAMFGAENTCREMAELTDAGTQRGEALRLHRNTARIARLLGDTSTEVEQLGYLADTLGVLSGVDNSLVAETYLHNISAARSQPVDARLAAILTHTGLVPYRLHVPPHRPLTVDQAVDRATAHQVLDP